MGRSVNRVQRLLHRTIALGLVALLAACGGGGDAVESVGGQKENLKALGGSNAMNAKSCQKNGWMNLVTSTGESFANESACVSYAARGGVLFQRLATQTITFGPLAAKSFGDSPFTVSATASSSLAVSFSAGGLCTVLGNTVQLIGAGSCTITANQAGSALWAPAPSVSQTFAIARGSQVVAFTSTNPSPAAIGAHYTPTADATSGLVVTITLDATSVGCTLADGVVSFVATGACRINANQAGDVNWAPASPVQQLIDIRMPTWTVTDGCLPAAEFVSLAVFKANNPIVTSLQCTTRNADVWRSDFATAVPVPATLSRTVGGFLGNTSSSFNNMTLQDLLLAPLPKSGGVQTSGELGTLQHLVGLALSIEANQLVFAAGTLTTPAPIAVMWANYRFNGNRYKDPAAGIDWGDTEIIGWVRLLMGYTVP